jgi:diguanylate cyclase (GGDEF)-like protein/PAS domain S-box-containing protein
MSRERIYIVEDERIIAIDLQRRLERLGYRVCGSAASGEEALAGIRQNVPDLVLMDIVIQGSVDGIEVAILIKKELNIPVIFLSAYTDTRTLDRAKEASPLGYILKPFKERELATILEMALYKSVADNRIREKEQLFSAILNSTTDAILVIGVNSEIVFMNPEAELILEVSDAESKNRRFGELFSLSDMETGELFQMPRFSSQIKVLKARNLRLTNWKNNSFVVEMTINREISASDRDENYIISFKDISRLHEMSDAIKYQTSHDTLTGLLNRNELAIRMNGTLAKFSQAAGPAVYAIFIDIDHFRLINDSCGTQAGDLLLRETSGRIRSFVTGSGYAARTGGDDFVLVCQVDPQDPKTDAEKLAKRLLADTRNAPFRWGGKEYPVTLSIAIVPLDPLFKNEHDLMIAGTQTVIATHESGGNRVATYTRSGSRGHNDISISEWISMIHDALLNDRFKLYYQPIEPLGKDNQKTKIEVLIRMVDQSGTIVQPDEFIPIAERYNIMPAVDRWVIKHAFETYACMRDANHPLSKSIFCINLSGASLADETIIGYIIDALDETRVPASQFCIEVTETNAILNLTSASRFIHILKEQGFTFALDDFGSGFSSFNYLKNLPVDYLKIDGCFIRNMDRDQVDYTMVQAIASMCKVLGLSTIGEFAENETIIGMLREIGVDYAQGYGISRPKPLE